MKKWKSLIMITCTAIALANKLPKGDLTVEKTLLLQNFPSGSSLDYFDNKLYLTGDDATQLLILDRDYNKVDSLHLFKGVYRVSKKKKTDLEASTIVTDNQVSNLILLGSASTRRREKLLILDVNNSTKKVSTFSIQTFNKRVVRLGVKDLNYEGLALVSDNLVLSNRGHINNPINQLIVTSKGFWKDQKAADLKVVKIRFDKSSGPFIGISGLTYIPSKDMLLFTASTEATADTYSDGNIEDSYLGWINNISTKLNLAEIVPNSLINLSIHHPSFKKQKVESVCMEAIFENTMLLHLVADNDNGQSMLFKVRLTL